MTMLALMLMACGGKRANAETADANTTLTAEATAANGETLNNDAVEKDAYPC